MSVKEMQMKEEKKNGLVATKIKKKQYLKYTQIRFNMEASEVKNC